eukprot:2352743-Pleurochrysis_carterae.AAC.1
MAIAIVSRRMHRHRHGVACTATAMESHAPPPPSPPACPQVSDACELLRLTSALRLAPDDPTRYYARSCKLLEMEARAQISSRKRHRG